MDIKKQWFVYYYEPVLNGTASKRIKIYDNINRAKTVKARKLIADRIIKEINSGSYDFKKPNIDNSSLFEFLETMKPRLREKTYITYHGQLVRWLAFISKNAFMATREDSVNFINSLHNANYRAKTVKTYQQNLKSIYKNYAQFKDLENFKNPFRNMAPIKVDSISLNYFNDYQISQIKNHLIKNDPEIWLLCQLQYYCFIRPNEARQLKADDFNLSAGYIQVRGEISKNKKTQKVSIPYSFMNDLAFVATLDPYTYIFLGKDENPLHRNTLTVRHKKTLEYLGIKGNYSLYSWKHTGVVKAVKAGIHIKDLQLQLRHHSLDMVNEYLKNLGVMDMERIKDLFPAI